MLAEAEERLARWRRATEDDRADASDAVEAVRRALRSDLDAPAALAAVDAWCESAPGDVIGSGQQVREAVEALLGVRL